MEFPTSFEFNPKFGQVRQLNLLGGQDNRMRKLQEEIGELGGALNDVADIYSPNTTTQYVRSDAIRAIASEAIDVLLMGLSILADDTPDDAKNDHINDLIGSAAFSSTIDWGQERGHHMIFFRRMKHYCRIGQLAGQIAEADQLLDGTASSLYKTQGQFDRITTAMHRREDIHRLIYNAIDIMVSTGLPGSSLQDLYDQKMAKWEKVAQQ